MKKKKILKSDFFYFIIAIIGLVIIVLFSLWQVNPENNELDVETKTKSVLTSANTALTFVDNLIPWKKLEFKKNNIFEKEVLDASYNDKEINTNIINKSKTVLSPENGKKRKIEFNFNNSEIAEVIHKGFFVYKNNYDIFLGFKNKNFRVFSIILHY
jgi:hypothetical protein